MSDPSKRYEIIIKENGIEIFNEICPDMTMTQNRDLEVMCDGGIRIIKPSRIIYTTINFYGVQKCLK